MKSTELFTFSVRRYNDGPTWGRRHLGPDRWAIDFGTISLIFECWWRRGGLKQY